MLMRIHMLSELALNKFLEGRPAGGRMPDSYAGKTTAAVEAGLPEAMAAVFRKINAMRNVVAHEQQTEMIDADLVELLQLVDGLIDVNPQFVPLDQRPSHIPRERRQSQDRGNMRKYDLAVAFYTLSGELDRWRESVGRLDEA